MGVRGLPDDDRATVDLGPRPTIEDGATVDDDDSVDAPFTVASPPPADMVHGLPTQQLANRAQRTSNGSPSGSRLSASATTSSPLEAMRHDEIERTRVFLKVVLGICFGGVIVALTSAGDPVARNVVLVGTAGSITGVVWMLFAMRDATKFSTRMYLVPGPLIIIGSMVGLYYWGAASPVAAMLVYGIYFFALGSNVQLITAMYVMVAVLHGLLGLGIVFGVLEDRGLVSMGGLRTIDQISLLSIIEFLYFIAFFTARVSQRVTLDAMTKLEQAAKTVAQRDALLAEARAELDRALKIGGPGRFSDQVIGGFRLGVLIGRGGMGEVYEASQVAGGREAAVKL
ncbi:MAG: hypothetical protein ABI867_42595, partial [Kofleriaceae bacterium]